MPTQYADIYMRDFPGDTGTIPSTTRDSVCTSPDIIPAGPSSVPNYQTVFAGNYNGPFTYYQNIQQSLYNYIYVRANNLFAGAQSGKIYLYYAPSSLLLTPAIWTNNLIPNSNSSDYANVTATATNQIVVGDAPFYWQPPPLAPAQGHYCLIAQVVTTQDPNPIPSGDNLGDFALWVASHPGIAWRNITVVNTLPGPSFSGFQGIANPSSSAALFSVTATCINIPDGTVVTLTCPVTGPIPAINSTQTVGPTNQTSSNPKTNTFGTVATLPANFTAQVQMSATVPTGVRPPFGSQITVAAYNDTSQTSPYAHIGIDPGRFGLTHEQIGFPEGGVMLLLGDYTYVFDVT
jgi:hypothetical protein